MSRGSSVTSWKGRVSPTPSSEGSADTRDQEGPRLGAFECDRFAAVISAHMNPSADLDLQRLLFERTADRKRHDGIVPAVRLKCDCTGHHECRRALQAVLAADCRDPSHTEG